MVSELVEWRLQRYLLAKQTAPEGAYILKVNHSGGKPILMLDRVRCPNLPEGDAEFLADGAVYVGRFVKVALNVAHRPGEESNQLASLLRSWFGPSAGLPGTSNAVALEVVDDRWVMRPIGVPGAGADDGTQVALFPELRSGLRSIQYRGPARPNAAGTWSCRLAPPASIGRGSSLLSRVATPWMAARSHPTRRPSALRVGTRFEPRRPPWRSGLDRAATGR